MIVKTEQEKGDEKKIDIPTSSDLWQRAPKDKETKSRKRQVTKCIPQGKRYKDYLDVEYHGIRTQCKHIRTKMINRLHISASVKMFHVEQSQRIKT